MHVHRIVAAVSAVFAAVALLGPPAQAQFWEKVKDRVTNAAEDETLDQLERKVRGAVRCTFDDLDCIERARQDGEEVVLTDEGGEILTDAEGNPVTDPSQLPPGKQAGSQAAREAHANYDFKPGERTIFAEDFSSDNVGDFPRSLEFVEGNLEVVAWRGGRALRGQTTGAFDVHLPEVLPERFTLEFDFYTPAFVSDIHVRMVDAEGEPAGANYLQVSGYSRNGIGLASNDRDGVSALDGEASAMILAEMTPIRLMADGSYVKVYVGTRRVANIPNADFGRSRTLRFILADVRSEPVYIGPIRVAAGGRDLYEALESEGRVAVQDILFDTGAATIQPASAEALQAIATLLTEHADLRLLVEGHTDDRGGFEANMALSKERAAAMKTYLVENHGIDGARLKTIGLGATQPAASNDTEAGRAGNRRVELVKL